MNYYHEFIIVKDKSNDNKIRVLLVYLLESNVILCGVDPFNSTLHFHMSQGPTPYSLALSSNQVLVDPCYVSHAKEATMVHVPEEMVVVRG